MRMNEKQRGETMDKLAILFRPKPQIPANYKLPLSELIRRRQFATSYEGELYKVSVKKVEIYR